MRFWRAVQALGIGLALTGQAGPPPASRYAEGQVWEYRTRPSDAGSLLKIQRIQDDPESAAMGAIYHISVIGVRLSEQPEPAPIGHLPVSKETLDASVIRLSSTSPTFPDVEEGIAEWRKAEGGVFNIPMAQIIDFADQTIGNGLAQDQK